MRVRLHFRGKNLLTFWQPETDCTAHSIGHGYTCRGIRQPGYPVQRWLKVIIWGCDCGHTFYAVVPVHSSG